mgnify:CR=1 FL=1
MSDIYFVKKENRVIIFAGNYYAVFEGNKVKGKIELQGLKVEFEGNTDKIPSNVQEANEIIKSLFYEQPKQVNYGSVVEASNGKVKIKTWGIIINDINALFNKLSEIKPLPVDIARLSLQYDMPLNKVKKILKEDPLKLEKEAYKYALSTFGNKLPRVEDLNEIKVVLDVTQDGGIVILAYKGKQIYRAKISFPTLYNYIKMTPEELIEEVVNLLEALVNLYGKAGDKGILPGVVEGTKEDSKIIIKSENEEAEIPAEDYEGVKEFISLLRNKLQKIIKK